MEKIKAFKREHKYLFWGIVIVLVIGILGSCGKDTETKEDKTVAKEKIVEEKMAEPETNIDEIFAMFKDKEPKAKELFDYAEFVLDKENKMVLFNCYTNGVVNEILLYGVSQEVHDDLINNMIELNNTMLRDLKGTGYMAVVNYLNDENPENVLITIVNGSVFYDFTEDYIK